MSVQKQSPALNGLDGWDDLFESLPGGEIILKGLTDIEHGENTEEALLVRIGGTRLRNLGLPVHKVKGFPEHRLYDLLSKHHPDSAHSRYNALIRLLVSFERAASCVKK